MEKLVILGGSGIGMIAASIAHDLGYYEVVGFINDVIPEGNLIGKYRQYKVIGKTDELEKFINMGCYFFIAYVGLENEKETFHKIDGLNIPRERFATLIHPTAIIPRGFTDIGNGCLLAPLSQLSPDTLISDNCIILGNAFVGHDSVLQKFAHIATNGVIGGNVSVGKAVHVGSNATVKEKVKIGDFALVGSGAVVLKDVPENAVVVGNPARILKQR